jgi:hypothetical protein
MKNIDYIKEEIIKALNESKYDGDLSDIGNIIGMTVAKFFAEESMGFEKVDFLAGIKHGISLIDGTHG